MKFSWYWVVVIALFAYHWGRNKGINAQAAADGRPIPTAIKLADALTPAKAIADALEPPVGAQTNPAGSSAWMP